MKKLLMMTSLALAALTTNANAQDCGGWSKSAIDAIEQKAAAVTQALASGTWPLSLRTAGNLMQNGAPPSMMIDLGLMVQAPKGGWETLKQPSQFRAQCFPKYEQWLASHAAHLEQKQVAKVQQEQAEAAKAQELARKQEAERVRQAEIGAQPQNQVRKAYSLYIMLRWCHELREGYAVQYVNDVEMQRVETSLAAILKRQKEKEPGMDTDALWQQADQSTNGKPIIQGACRMWLQQLTDMSPVPAIRVQKPAY
jgi:hypothetical protein